MWIKNIRQAHFSLDKPSSAMVRNIFTQSEQCAGALTCNPGSIFPCQNIKIMFFYIPLYKKLVTDTFSM